MRNVPHFCLIEEFDNVEAFLSALVLRDERWGYAPREWIFRGQGNRDWNLVPSALRPTADFPYEGGSRFHRSDNIFEQVMSEFRLILDFAKEVNKQGLALPSEESYRWLDLERRFIHELRRGLPFPDPDTVHTWPWPEIAPLIALAQHYGVPTRLLDWTERPLVAAYFAALQAVNTQSTEAFSVWALHQDHARSALGISLSGEPHIELRVIRVPRATNPNLHAQAGIFTALNHFYPVESNGLDVLLLDQLLEQKALLATTVDFPFYPLLQRLDLPASLAGRLLRMLADEGINATSLHPGYEGAVRGLTERQYWRR